MSRCVLFAEVPGFYATIERSEDPALADRPVIVGGDPRKRGSVQSMTPDALAAGVALEMPMLEALRLCPQARAVRTDMARYREVSRRLFACLRRELSALEPLGLGAGYCDVSLEQDPDALGARAIARVRGELGLPLRIGIASGKFVARLAAGEVAPGCVRRIDPGAECAFLAPLPVSRLDGVGQKTAAALGELGVQTIGQVAELGRARLEALFGTHGLRIHAYAAGSDDEPVRATRHPQSLSREVTVRAEGLDVAALGQHLQDLARHLEQELRLQGLFAGKVALKVRFADQTTTTRSQTLVEPAAAAPEIQRVVEVLMARTQAGARAVRGLGIQLSRLAPARADRQLPLFPS